MTPEQEEQVRRALAAAAGREQDGPPGSASHPDAAIPPEVAARLDEVLAELTASTTARMPSHSGRTTEEGSSVAQVSTARGERRARRRPTTGSLLLAAAAVSVIALAGGAAVTGGLAGLGGSGSDSAGSTTAEAGGSGGSARDEGGATDSGGPENGEPPPTAADPGAPPRVRGDALRRDVQRLVDDPPARGGPDRRCARPPAPAGARLFAVRWDGQVATLVISPAEGGRRPARVYSCTAAQPLGRTTVDAR